jgi:hypothetical protein
MWCPTQGGWSNLPSARITKAAPFLPSRTKPPHPDNYQSGSGSRAGSDLDNKKSCQACGLTCRCRRLPSDCPAGKLRKQGPAGRCAGGQGSRAALQAAGKPLQRASGRLPDASKPLGLSSVASWQILAAASCSMCHTGHSAAGSKRCGLRL